MEKIQHHFDVNKVVTIKYIPEQVCTWMKWVESQPIKKFFGLFYTGKFSPAGWIDNSEYNPKIYSETDLIKKDYLVKDYVVYRKSKVKITLTNNEELFKTFNTQEECMSWIEDLKDTTGKTFEII